ncbi:hypothetical protein C9374_007202 [Naegleria lovaniensis]|uniref:Rhodanese domain-containing protein n=1 Tax=Naegleria lovaniensis TaxID=51637 RepID=A0AA88H6X3_NAELO|nr:uncharacterized protein C9374_007202 [Naegleria lovaniensis]KAG2393671.1 hypothetical protein C9374_007202 [Naegleria lovaniensis]
MSVTIPLLTPTSLFKKKDISPEIRTINQMKSLLKNVLVLTHHHHQKGASMRRLLLLSSQTQQFSQFSTSAISSYKEVEFTSVRDLLETAPNIQIVDVRTQQEFEHAEHKFRKGFNLPVQTLESNMSLLDKTKPTYVVCQSGIRAKRASDLLSQSGFTDVICIKGGFNDIKNTCKPQDDPIVQVKPAGAAGSSSVWSMERQVRFTAGAFVVAGVAGFAVTGNPVFLGLPGFIGCGLMYSAYTNTCAMGVALMKMPWNKMNPQASCATLKK